MNNKLLLGSFTFSLLGFLALDTLVYHLPPGAAAIDSAIWAGLTALFVGLWHSSRYR